MTDSSALREAQGWRLDEVRSAGRENLDPDHVAVYDRKEAWDVEAELTKLRSLGFGPDTTLVDMGAGTGQLAVAAAARCRSVVAVDVSPVMLAHLRAKATACGAENIQVVHAGFASYDHVGPHADIVYSRWALHHVPDFWKAVGIARVRRAINPGGRLRLLDIAYSFAPHEAEQRIEQWCQTLPVTADTADAWVRADIEEHVRDEHSTFTWLLEPIIERNGFRIDEATYSDDGIFAEYVATAI